jgi:tetratricopeptide (TPR) repeat protein/predicted Ser/Thr protein kinase
VDQTINMDWVDRLGADLRTCWRFGQRLPVEEYLKQDARLPSSGEAVLVLIAHEVEARRELGERPVVSEYLLRFPHLASRLRKRFPDESSPTAVDPACHSDNGESPSHTQPVSAAGESRAAADASHAATLSFAGTPRASPPAATAPSPREAGGEGSHATTVSFPGLAADPKAPADRSHAATLSFPGLAASAPKPDPSSAEHRQTLSLPVPSGQPVAETPTVDLPRSGAARGETLSHIPGATDREFFPTLNVRVKASLPRMPGAPDVPGYTILGELGKGGMGIVYKAEQSGLKRLVALKMILSGERARNDEIARFRSEAEAIARLDHPNIVKIYEVGEFDGQPYFSLEFVEGGSLSHHLRKNTLAPREASRMAEVLARAMHAAHERGIVHRDLKPANILLTADGTPKITDFGLAKNLGEDAGKTRDGQVLGTPSYMAPEQAAGEIEIIGPPADTYALGGILYEMLIGRPPFKGASVMEVLVQVRMDEPMPPRTLDPKVPPDLQTICLKCLEKLPAKRYASALDLAEDLRRWQAGEPIHARAATRRERLWKWVKRHPLKAAAVGTSAAALCFGVVALCFFGLYQSQQVRLARKVLENYEGAQRSADRGQQLMTEGQWEGAVAALTEARGMVGSEEKLADVRGRIDELLVDAEKGAAQQRAKRRHEQNVKTLEHYTQEALAQTSPVNGANADWKRVRQLAQSGLAAFGMDDPARLAPDIDRASCDEQAAGDITENCSLLLLVLADATAHVAGADEKPVEQAGQALAVLKRTAPLFERPSRALRVQRARYLKQEGQAAAAAAEEAAAANVKPATSLDWLLLGIQCLGDETGRGRDVKQALEHFTRAVDGRSGSFWPHYYLAVCNTFADRERDLKAARSELTLCAGLRADFEWVYILRGFVQGELDAFAAAEEDFARAEQIVKRNANVDAEYILRVNRSAVRFRRAGPPATPADLRAAQLAEAARDLEEAIRLKPNTLMAHVNLGQVRQRQRQPDKALAEFTRAVQLRPGMPALYRERARLHQERQDWDAALADFERAIALDRPAGDKLLAEDLTSKGRLLWQQQKPVEALAAFDAALVASSEHPAAAPAAQMARAELLLEMKRFPEALTALDGFLERQKTSDAYLQKTSEAQLQRISYAHRVRGQVRTHLGNLAGAVDDFSKAIDLTKPPDSKLYAHRGWVYLVSNAPRIAVHDFDKAIELDPANGDAYNGRGFARARLATTLESKSAGQALIKGAVADADDALRLEKEATPRTLYSAARVYAQAFAALGPAVRNEPATLQKQRARYKSRAFELMRAALDLVKPEQQAGFWKDYVHTDEALNALRPLPQFGELASRYGRGQRVLYKNEAPKGPNP